MIERAFWKLIKICWYAAIAFLFCLAMVLTDKDAFIPAYICMVVMALMGWISLQASKRGGRK